MSKQSAIVVLVLGACAAPPIEPTVTFEARRCATCGDNGLVPDAWRMAPAAFGTLGSAGLRVGPHIKPICNLTTVTTTPTGTSCELDAQWSAWAGLDYLHEELVRYMVKVGASNGALVTDPGAGLAFVGGFGLAPTILTTPWDVPAQSIVTAGMAVNVDYYANAVEICIKTASTPDCPAAYSFQEIAASGNLFAGEREVVVGGYAALRPEDSRRVCPGFGGCNTYSGVEPYYAASCIYGGPSWQRYPLSCNDGSHVRSFPVQVFLETDPAVFGATSSAGSGRPML
ncbi:MAG: hypothetical protein ACKV2T_39910 [Kofleriaceae bacterium]